MSDKDQTGIHPLLTVVAALVIFVSVVGGYVWFNNKPPADAGEVVSVSAYPIHRELSTGSALGGISGGPNVYDELIVIADVRITSKTNEPTSLFEVWGDVTLANGDTQRCLAANATDYHKVFIAYPDLAPQQKSPLPRGATVAPGQQIEGQLIFHYPITKQQWDQKNSFDIDIEFTHQKDLVLHVTPDGTGNAK
jgi:hypothetical protein